MRENNGDYARIRENNKEFPKKTYKNKEISWFFVLYHEIQSFFGNYIAFCIYIIYNSLRNDKIMKLLCFFHVFFRFYLYVKGTAAHAVLFV